MEKENFNVWKMIVLITIRTWTTIQTMDTNVVIVIQLILQEIGSLMDTVLPRTVSFSLVQSRT